ncbi:dienelactone hydrolase family protein [Robertkochia flava]|uniref:dienelactone hydrolase family protein n=1 Tax=Robertkochia flava TaxID=3447986 RepID=UPI001CCB8DDC|nr:dienelactone hydrolase family protein [Robertkochia marina]
MKTYTACILLLLTGMISCKQEEKSTTSEVEDSTTEEIVEIDIRGKEITYQSDSTMMKGYMAWNENATEKAPGILVIHEWWGHNDYTRERADMLAELGYVAFAIDMYGEGKQAEHPDEAGKFANMVMSNMDEAEARFNAALELLKQNEHVDPEKIAAIGYCFGGSVALTMANTGADLDAVAAFHSGINLPVPPNDDLKARVLVCNGAADPMVSAEDVAKFTSAMDSTGVTYEYIAYEDAMHAFTSKAADSLGKTFDLPLAYNEEADRKSWEALKAMLDEVF